MELKELLGESIAFVSVAIECTKKLLSLKILNLNFIGYGKLAQRYIYELNHRIYEKYKLVDYNRAIKAYAKLRDALVNYHN